jgi:co-chaperonin GroES (HSP10)
MRPLGDRVLVKPYKNPNVTESGLHLPENRGDQYVEMQGEVVAVGLMTHPRRAEADELARELWSCELAIARQIKTPTFNPEAKADSLMRAGVLLHELTQREPVVSIGDQVLYSWASGQEITIDDERYILLREEELLAVLETA